MSVRPPNKHAVVRKALRCHPLSESDHARVWRSCCAAKLLSAAVICRVWQLLWGHVEVSLLVAASGGKHGPMTLATDRAEKS